MRDLWGMKEDAVLNDASHLVAGVGHTRLSQVIEVTINRGHAVCCGLAHGTGGLFTPVDGLVGEANFYRVLRPTEGEDVDCRKHAVLSTIDCEYMEPILTVRIRDSRADPRYRADRSERRRGGRCGDCGRTRALLCRR